MILNLAEIWIVLAVAFVVGCLAGAVLYRQLATTRYADVQDAIAADISGTFAGMREGIDGAARQSRQTLAGAFRRRPAAVEGGAVPPATTAPSPAIPDVPAAAPPEPKPDEDSTEPHAVSEPTSEEILAGRPTALIEPRDGEGDDLRRIRGIGESYEARLHALGIFHYDQIAAWSLKQAAWVAIETGAGDRVVRYDWIGQAKALAGTDDGPPDEG